MKKLQKDLHSAVKALTTIAKKLDTISQQLEGLGKVKAASKSKSKSQRKASKRAVKVTASDTVLQVISRSKKPVGMAAIEKKTGFNKKKIQNIVFTFRKRGKIRSAAKGLYEKT